jgi:aspartate--ammonia ligase
LKPLAIKKTADGTLWLPVGYHSPLTLRQREEAIKFIKDGFEKNLARALHLQRVSAPLAVLADTGINDALNGVEKPASFVVKDLTRRGEIVQSLAKWKRAALADYGFEPGEGIYTDMNAIRPDERLDNLHSIYVDQWDWERVITRTDRSARFLKQIVRKIYAVLRRAEQQVCRRYPELGRPYLPQRVTFVHSEELEARYPKLSPRERELAICKKQKAVFIIGIGAALKNGQPHDGRASDYDDWCTPSELGRPGLNGDLFVFNPILDCAFELSSMGIRVDPKSLKQQLAIRGDLARQKLPFHQRLLKGQLPLCIGGGIGQSRLCMLLMRQAHVGEVQASIWSDATRRACAKHGIQLL